MSVTPRDALTDRPVTIRAVGLEPKEQVELTASTVDASGSVWRSRSSLVADRHGSLDTHFAMKPFWSMSKLGSQRQTSDHLRLPAVSRVALSLVASRRTVVRTTLVRRTIAPGVARKDLTYANDGLVGTFYSQPSTTRGVAVLTVGGSAGGHGTSNAALFASHGIPTLSLGYFAEPGLPPRLQDIPLEYFEQALRWLATQPGVDPKRIGVVGVSRGAELALLLARYYPELVHGVVACTTDAFVLGGLPSGRAWPINGQPVPFSILPIERITVPTLITGGGKDEIIDSAAATKRLLDVARTQHETNVSGRIFPNAGHGAGCVAPNVPAPGVAETSPGTFLSLGGTPAGNALAAVSAWPALLRFLNAL
jgi:dienelactone hydrolase